MTANDIYTIFAVIVILAALGIFVYEFGLSRRYSGKPKRKPEPKGEVDLGVSMRDLYDDMLASFDGNHDAVREAWNASTDAMIDDYIGSDGKRVGRWNPVKRKYE